MPIQAHGYKHVVVAQLAGLWSLIASRSVLHISNDISAVLNITLALTELPYTMANIGLRLLPNFIDEIALADPNAIFVEVPKTTIIDEGLHKVTFSSLARSIDKCAWWIQTQLGKGRGFPTLAYIGPHDLRYLFLVFGACKAGYKVCPFLPLV